MKSGIVHGIDSLSQIIREFLYKNIELLRVCRTAVLLTECGVNPFNNVYNELAIECLKNQREDGGWTDVEETLWCTALLNLFYDYQDIVKKAIEWINGQEHIDGCWGMSIRDQARIPITSLLLYYLPQLRTTNRLKWLENKWTQEQELDPNLTYKVALILMVFSQAGYEPKNRQSIDKSIKWLCQQQNDDGGWGPWKDHPAGSDSWCTGICIVSLTHFPGKVPTKVLSNGLTWIKRKQLPNGLWPYHYIEDGSSWALYALIRGENFIYDRQA